jgi:hypothetical protein
MLNPMQRLFPFGGRLKWDTPLTNHSVMGIYLGAFGSVYLFGLRLPQYNPRLNKPSGS